jgi:hypothetical protein
MLASHPIDVMLLGMTITPRWTRRFWIAEADAAAERPPP